MKTYYYSKGEEKFGPFTIEEMQSKRLTPETLIWTNGMTEWLQLCNDKELYSLLFNVTNPPPLPVLTNKKQTKNLTVETKPNRKGIRFLLIWETFHFIAFILSFSKTPIFNDPSYYEVKEETKSFWPFTKILQWSDIRYSGYSDELYFDKYWDFNGLFYKYDYTEFLFYSVGGVLIYFIIRFQTSNK